MNRIVTAFALALSLEDPSKYPMKADEFKAHISTRLTKAQEHLETHIKDKKVDEAKAKELRAKFAAGVAQVKAKVEEVAADGTVTLDEAKAVRVVMHDNLRGGHGKKHEKKA